MQSRQFHTALIAVAMLAGLSACASHPPAPELTAPTPPPPSVEAPPLPTLKPPPPKSRPPSSETQTHIDDITLIGLSRPEVTALLGDPQEQKDSSPGHTWIYRSGSCSAELLFLLDVVRNDDFVVDRRIDGTDGTPKSEQLCLRRIASHHGK